MNRMKYTALSQYVQSRAELTQMMRQVHQIADKAIDGASYGKAFQSVNQIAMEQARRTSAGEMTGENTKK